MNHANRLSLATNLIEGDQTFAPAAKVRLAQRIADAEKILVLSVEPLTRGFAVAVHLHGAYRPVEVICGPKFRSQLRRLGATI